MAGGASTFITPTMVARVGIATLFNNFVPSPEAGFRCATSTTPSRSKVGDTVTIRKPPVFTANVFSRATDIVIQDPDRVERAVQLSTIADVSFAVTAEDLTLRIDDFRTRLLTPALNALVQQIDTTLANALVAAALGGGGGGTVTMTSVGSDALIKAREVLTRNKLPISQRYACILSPEATSGCAVGSAVRAGATGGHHRRPAQRQRRARVPGPTRTKSGTFGFGPRPRQSRPTAA